jgi:hypothetical protein
LGVTPSAWTSPDFRGLQVGSGIAVYGRGSGDADRGGMAANAYNDGSWKYIATGNATRAEQSDGTHAWYTAASGTAGNAITFTQAMTLDASGNLGVGTTSPASFDTSGLPLVVGNGSGNRGISIYAGTSSSSSINFADGTSGTDRYVGQIEYTHGSNAMLFYTNATERARIDSSGNLLVGTTSYFNGTARLSITATAAAQNVLQTRPTTDITYYPAIFENSSGTTVGYIQSTSTITAYITTSDYRLKNSIAPMTSALAKVALLKPCTYKWNADGSDGEGFIAHELAEVCPNAVSGEKDAVDENGNPKYQGIDTSFLVATLTAAIQELKAEFDAYKASHP